MKFVAIAAFLFSAVAVSSAALPVEPKNAYALAEDQTLAQNVFGDKPKNVLPLTVKSYIVVFKQSAASEAIEKVARDISDFGGKIGHRYDTVLRGFQAWIPAPVVSAMATNPFIDYIEEDGEVSASN